MYRIGRIALYLGITLILVGLIVGFTVMFVSRSNSAIAWIGLIPVGFISILVGTVGVLLGSPDRKS